MSDDRKKDETCTRLFLEGVARQTATAGRRGTHEQGPVEEVVLVQGRGHPVGN